MAVALPGAPFAITYRELWLPPGIKGWTGPLPSSIQGGHGLAFTGARKGTTCDGVRFFGDAASNINCGVVNNNVPKFWVSFRFTPGVDFGAGSPNTQTMFAKNVDNNNFINLQLHTGTGSLRFRDLTGGEILVDLFSAEVSWNAGQTYHVLASVSDTVPAQRLIIDGGTPVTSANAAINIVNGGRQTIGHFDDPGDANGFIGIIEDVFIGTDDLSTAEETDLFNGIPPADAVNAYPLDEGRGVTIYDRGSGGNNGTLDTSPAWAWGQVEQPVLSLDGINDRGVSGAGVDIAGALTFVWAGKVKSTYDTLAANHYMASLFIDVDNQIFLNYDQPNDAIRLYVEGGTVSAVTYYDTSVGAVAIDDYLILIGTVEASGRISLYAQGVLVDSDTGAGARVGAATAYIGSTNGATFFDISKPLLAGLIEGAFTRKQALDYSRYLNNIFNLPINI